MFKSKELQRFAQILTPALVLSIPLVKFLDYHYYPLLEPEALLALSPFWVVGLIFGAVIALRPSILGPALLPLLLLPCALLVFVGPLSFDLWAPSEWPDAVGLFFLSVSIATVLTCILLRQHLSEILFFVALTILLSASLLPGERDPRGSMTLGKARAGENLPPIIHLILDEHIGIEAIPLDIASGQELREEIKDFYQRHGFELYGRAYSHARKTHFALAGLMNGKAFPDQETAFHSPNPKIKTNELKQNLWFDLLAAKGYRIKSHFTNHFGFCPEDNDAMAFCSMVSSNSISFLIGKSNSVLDKAKVILLHFFQRGALSGLTKRLGFKKLYLGSLYGPDLLQRLASDIEVESKGMVFFAHVLFPHASYLYQEDCRIIDEVMHPRSSTMDYSSDAATERTASYEAYFAQLRCLYAELDRFFSRLEAAGLRESAIIIVHGDHGSRIGSFPENSESEPTAQTLLDHYSTLYAVRRPGEPGGYNRAIRSVQELFAEEFLGIAQEAQTPRVVLQGSTNDDQSLVWHTFDPYE